MAGENTKELTVGEALRRWRLGLGVTQAELASRVGVSASLIALFESGKRQPRLDRTLALAEALGMSRTQRNALLARVGLNPSHVGTFDAHLEFDQRQLKSRKRMWHKFLVSQLEMAVMFLSNDTALRPAERRLLQSISQKVQQFRALRPAERRLSRSLSQKVQQFRRVHRPRSLRP